MHLHARLSLLTVVLLAVAACSTGEASQPETTSTPAQEATTSTTAQETTTSSASPTTTTTTSAATTTTSSSTTTVTTVESTTTTSSVTTTTTAPSSTTTVTQATTTTAQPASRQLTITIAGFQYSGDTTGRVGDTVRVVNNDVVSHTWTAKNGAFDSGSIGPGQAFSYTFSQAGTFDFFCIPHPGMVGSITITA